jgi:DegV family protein with EDD domain
MHLSHLSPTLLHQAIIKGCQSVISVREQLNAINIFPVADGDTGDNLASTATAIIANSHTKPRLTDMLESVAEASLRGARGNSGIIFSQFFNALAVDPGTATEMDTRNFSATLVNVAINVRAAISSPIDGTMLTMIEAFANTASMLSKDTSCFNQLMGKLRPILKATLDATAESIPVLRDAQVVDAGALGFYFFVDGFASLLSGERLSENNYPTSIAHPIEHKHTLLETRPLHRYCTEVILKSDVIDKTGLSKVLEHYGDCLAFTGNQKTCRVHIHSNKPSDIFSSLMDHGTLEYPKIDDMLRQFQVLHDRNHDIALVTDSSADLPQALKDEYQVHQIPLNIHIDEHHLLDRYCIEPNVFYENLNTLKAHPKTSLPSPVLIEEKLSFLSQQYKHVLVISIAKALSGTFDALARAAQKYPNVRVINSCTSSGAQGLLVQYAGELIREGQSFQTIINAVSDAIPETSLFVMVNDLETMVRSGRINKIAGRIGQFSGIKPIISIDNDGKGSYFATAFNADHALSKLITITKKMQSEPGKELERYCIVHAGVEEKARAFAHLTTEAFQKSPAYIENVSSAIGLHAGHGCIAIAARIRSSRRTGN